MTMGWTYDFRHIAGVLPSSVDTSRMASATFRFASAALLGRSQLGEHRRASQRAAPCAEVLRAVGADAAAHVRAHVVRREHAPAAVAAIAEQPRARRFELSRNELRELAIVHDLPLPHAALAAIREEREAVLYSHVRLAQRRDAERAVLAQVAFAAHAAERLADQAQYARGHGVRVEAVGARSGPRVVAQRATDARQFLGKLSHSVVLAQFASLHRAIVVAILLPSARIDPPRLDRRAAASAATCTSRHAGGTRSASIRSSVRRSRTTCPEASAYRNPDRAVPSRLIQAVTTADAGKTRTCRSRKRLDARLRL